MIKEIMINLSERKDAPSTKIHCKVFSQFEELGQRDVLMMVPGGPGNDYWLYDNPGLSIAEALFPFVDVILFDPRGCGKSDEALVDHYIEDIESIRQHFNLESDRFLIFAQSYGAIAAIGYAIKYSRHLKRLALIGGASSGEVLDQAKENLAKIGTEEQIRWGEKIWTGTFVDSNEEMQEFYQVLGPLYSYTVSEGEEAPDVPCNVPVLNFGFGEFLHQFDFLNGLANITCPVMIMWGKQDWIFDIKQSELLVEKIPDCELDVFDECGHMLWIDQWDKFFSKMKGFLMV